MQFSFRLQVELHSETDFISCEHQTHTQSSRVQTRPPPSVTQDSERESVSRDDDIRGA